MALKIKSEDGTVVKTLTKVAWRRPWRMAMTVCFTLSSRKVWPPHLTGLREHLESEARAYLENLDYDIGSIVSEADYSYKWKT